MHRSGPRPQDPRPRTLNLLIPDWGEADPSMVVRTRASWLQCLSSPQSPWRAAPASPPWIGGTALWVAASARCRLSPPPRCSRRMAAPAEG
jgi:hypothetical protein